MFTGCGDSSNTYKPSMTTVPPSDNEVSGSDSGSRGFVVMSDSSRDIDPHNEILDLHDDLVRNQIDTKLSSASDMSVNDLGVPEVVESHKRVALQSILRASSRSSLQLASGANSKDEISNPTRASRRRVKFSGTGHSASSGGSDRSRKSLPVNRIIDRFERKIKDEKFSRPIVATSMPIYAVPTDVPETDPGESRGIIAAPSTTPDETTTTETPSEEDIEDEGDYKSIFPDLADIVWGLEDLLLLDGQDSNYENVPDFPTLEALVEWMGEKYATEFMVAAKKIINIYDDAMEKQLPGTSFRPLQILFNSIGMARDAYEADCTPGYAAQRKNASNQQSALSHLKLI
jgi:hypothetical protein